MNASTTTTVLSAKTLSKMTAAAFAKVCAANNVSWTSGRRLDAITILTTPAKTPVAADAKAAPAPIAAPTVKGKRAAKPAPVVAEAPKKRGRKSLAETLTPAEIKGEIDELLSDLRKSTDTDEKKRLRRALRLRGHLGGLGETTTDSDVAGE
jgi:hypothetical protein